MCVLGEGEESRLLKYQVSVLYSGVFFSVYVMLNRAEQSTIRRERKFGVATVFKFK